MASDCKLRSIPLGPAGSVRSVCTRPDWKGNENRSVVVLNLSVGSDTQRKEIEGPSIRTFAPLSGFPELVFLLPSILLSRNP